MCWFDIVRNMWMFLATAHAPTTANENLENKPYFCLGLLANLADLLRPVNTISIVLVIFLPFLPYLHREIASCWACWTIVERNQLSLNLMCLEIPWKMGVRALLRHTLPCWMDFLVRASWTAETWAFYYYCMERRLACDLGFLWYITQDMEWTKYPWGQYSLLHCSVSCVAQDLSNLVLLCLPSCM